MSAYISDRQETLSVSVYTDTTSKNTANQSDSKSKQNNNSKTQSSDKSTEISLDSFEFSNVKNFSELTYSAKVFQKSNITDNAKPKETVTLPQSMETIAKEANQRLNDYFGSDSSKRKEYQSALDTLGNLDPELAQKAFFLITLLSQEEATDFLSDISTFTSNIRQTLTTDFSINIVASAQSTSIDNIYTSMRNDTAMAIEKYQEIVSEKFDIEINFFSDPLVLDLAGDGIELTKTEDGVEFDIDGDGTKEQTAFIKGDDALLYLDQNGNGTVDNGKELFGDQEGDANGYSKLAKYDENNDGKIDELDAVYTKLRLWQDKNEDGKNQSTESMSLLEAGIKSIQLKYNEIMKDDNRGNKIGQTSEFTRTDGSKGYSADMLFRTQAKHNRISDLLLA